MKGVSIIDMHFAVHMADTVHYVLFVSQPKLKILLFVKSQQNVELWSFIIWNTQYLWNLFVGSHTGRLHNTARKNKLEKADALTATNCNLITLSITFTQHSRSPSLYWQTSAVHVASSSGTNHIECKIKRHCYPSVSSKPFKLPAVAGHAEYFIACI